MSPLRFCLLGFLACVPVAATAGSTAASHDAICTRAPAKTPGSTAVMAATEAPGTKSGSRGCRSEARKNSKCCSTTATSRHGSNCAGVSACARTGSPKTASASVAAPAKPIATHAEAGMTVALDPETGALGAPSGEQVRALGLEERAVSRTAEGLIEIYRTDGAVGMDLRGRFQDYIVARIGKNGRPIFGCLHGDRGVAPAAGDSVPAPAALEEW